MKKGFTLIELLGVIVVLGIIGVITVPVVQNVIKESASEVDKAQEESFKKAARNLVNSNPYYYECGKTYKITLDELADKGFIDRNNIKTTSGSSYEGCVQVTVSCPSNNYKFSYEYKDNCN